MKTIVLGARGTLGQALTAVLPQKGFDVVAALGRSSCDITDPRAVDKVITETSPNIVFNAAAYTDVDGAEDDDQACWMANARGPEVLAAACAVRRIPLMHYSTDFVFDGTASRPYDEFDPVSPQGVYARSKVAGERLALAANPQTYVVRVGCLYGKGGRNFPSTIRDRLVRGESIKADKSRFGSPTWVVPVAETSAELVKTGHFGLYHATADGETTWADYALFLAQKLGTDPAKIAALDVGALKLKAARPVRAILENRMLAVRGLEPIGTWQQHAERFLASFDT